MSAVSTAKVANNTKYFSIKNVIKILDNLVKVNMYNIKNKNTSHNIALAIRGVHGIGKTEGVESYAKSKSYNFEKLECAQLDDVTYLTGYPRQTYKVSKVETVKVPVSENPAGSKQVRTIRYALVSEIDRYLADGWTQETTIPELTYSKPEWVTALGKNDKPGILFIDEVNRGLPFIINAIMNVINNGGYNTWQLPKNTTVVLAMNPDDGESKISKRIH